MKSPLLQIGGYDLYPIETGTFGLDGGAMFGIVPKVMWEKRYPCDAKNRIPMASRSLLCVGHGHKILIDNGLGDKWSAKDVDIYAIEQQSNSLLQSLKAQGLGFADITDVVLTHLHFDHAGGSTRVDAASGKVIPTFPNATYHVQSLNWKRANAPTPRDRASYLPEDFAVLKEADQLKLYLGPQGFDHDIEIFPNMQPLLCHGHTPGLQMIKISDAKHTLVYTADTCPTHAHLPSAYVMGYDLQPLVAVEEKEALLQKCRDENWLLFFEHDAKIAAAEIAFDEKNRPFVKRGL